MLYALLIYEKPDLSRLLPRNRTVVAAAEAYDRAIGLSEDAAVRAFLTERRNRLTPQ